MPIVSHVQLMVPMSVAAPTRLGDKWAERLQSEAAYINQNRKSRIPDEATFQARLARPSHLGFSPMVNPGFYTRSGLNGDEVVINQQANIERAYEKYRTSLDYMFAEVDGEVAKRFKDLVAYKKANYLKGISERTLPFTGMRQDVLGAAAIASLWLTNDLMVLDFLRGGDNQLAGGPYLITSHRKKAQLKAMLTGRLIQAGALMLKSGLNAALMATHNQVTNEEIQGFTDPALDLIPFVAGGDSHVDYVLDKGALWLEIKVSKM